MATQVSTLTQMLCLGAKGLPVSELQSKLGLQTDGRFGRKTHSAVLGFQQRHGLKADGMVGAKTAAALGWPFAGASPPPYRIRYDRPPMAGATPPWTVIGAVMRAGFDQVKAKLLEEVDRNGLSEQGRQNARREIETRLYPELLRAIDACLARRKGTLEADVSEGMHVQMFRRRIIDFFVLLKELGERMKSVGGKVDDYMALVRRGVDLDAVVGPAEALARGDMSAPIAVDQVRAAFGKVVGQF